MSQQTPPPSNTPATPPPAGGPSVTPVQPTSRWKKWAVAGLAAIGLIALVKSFEQDALQPQPQPQPNNTAQDQLFRVSSPAYFRSAPISNDDTTIHGQIIKGGCIRFVGDGPENFADVELTRLENNEKVRGWVTKRALEAAAGMTAGQCKAAVAPAPPPPKPYILQSNQPLRYAPGTNSLSVVDLQTQSCVTVRSEGAMNAFHLVSVKTTHGQVHEGYISKDALTPAPAEYGPGNCWARLR